MTFKLTKNSNQRLIKHIYHRIAADGAVCDQNAEI